MLNQGFKRHVIASLRQDQEQNAIQEAKPQERYPKCWAPQFGLGQIARDCLVAKSLWNESIFLDEHLKTIYAPILRPDDGSPRIAYLLIMQRIFS
jgi:hypothetical protein